MSKRGHNSKVQAGPISARLEGFIQRILKLEARRAEIAQEILAMEVEAGIKHVWTYIIRAGESDMVKIGITTDAIGRLASLQTAHPEKLKIIRLIRGNGESALHHHFAKNRIRGEWFRFAPSMLTVRVAGCINFNGAL